MSPAATLYVLDTTVLSQLVSDVPDAATAEWLRTAPRGSLLVPAGAVYEVRLGVELARRNGNRRADRYERRLREALADERFPVVAVDADVACLRAVLAADAALHHLALADPRSRRPAASERLAIAATAMAFGATVATLDRTAFASIASRHAIAGILDPSTGTWTGPLGDCDRCCHFPLGRPVPASVPCQGPGLPAGRQDCGTARTPCNGSLTDSEGFRRPDCESDGATHRIR